MKVVPNLSSTFYIWKKGQKEQDVLTGYSISDQLPQAWLRFLLLLLAAVSSQDVFLLPTYATGLTLLSLFQNDQLPPTYLPTFQEVIS